MNPYLRIYVKLNWPSEPIDFNTTYALMKDMPHRFQVICALEAAKMVLPIWEEYAYKDEALSQGLKEAPRKAIEVTEKWLDKKVVKGEVFDASDVAYIAANNAPRNIDNAARSAAGAANTVFSKESYEYSAYSAAHAAEHAAITCYFDYHILIRSNIKLQFYREWWDRCCDLMQAEIDNKWI